MYGFKECSSCGALYNKSCGCSKGGFVDKCGNPVDGLYCPKCGNPVDGLYCRQCALLRKKLKEVWFTICDENEIFQDFLNTSESSNDNTNVVNAPQEPFSCGNGAHYGYNCPLKVLIISNPEPCYNQNVDEFPQSLPSFHPTCYSGDENSFTYDSNLYFVDDSPNPPPQPPTEELSDNINTPNWNRPAFYHDDDEDDVKEYTIAITPILPTVEPDNSPTVVLTF
ncbi:hypothetical protein Tco_0959141 [Tanacetum coccineum]